jgi:glutathione synthase/RimK-type ligase-like ATP-grasp enzyme
MKPVKDWTPVKRIRKTMIYARLRQHFPMRKPQYVDDTSQLDDAEVVRIDWPEDVAKPRVGIVRDFEQFPRWTKYARFLKANGFPYDLYDIHAHDWIDKARAFDIVIGLVSNEINRLEEIRVKYHVLAAHLGKLCYPSPAHALLYENKSLEAYIARVHGLPFARTYVSRSREDALAVLEQARFPLVSKVNFSSGSMGVEIVRTPRKARRIVEQAFSCRGRSVHIPWSRQKNYVYFQEFVPNDGYDVRVILVGDRAFGYFRKVLKGDFRASGMSTVEKRGLPEEAIRVALDVQRHVRSPLLVVDMVRGLDGRYVIIEYSITCLVRNAEQLIVEGVPGIYVIEDDGGIRFEPGRYWIHELALREFLLKEYLPRATGDPAPTCS